MRSSKSGQFLTTHEPLWLRLILRVSGFLVAENSGLGLFARSYLSEIGKTVCFPFTLISAKIKRTEYAVLETSSYERTGGMKHIQMRNELISTPYKAHMEPLT